MTSALGMRVGWTDLTLDVRDAVDTIDGGAIVRAVSQAGGFSPETADWFGLPVAGVRG